MNSCNSKFIENIKIDFSKIDRKVYSKKNINEIVAKYEIQGLEIDDYVCLDNIYGVSDNQICSCTFPEVLDYFFDEKGDGYHTRALGMLEYDEKNIISNLSHSFKSEPIVLLEIEKDKNIILTNGMHRFMVLRLLYLNEQAKCNSQEGLDKLKLEFTIPVKKVKVDLIKTYCKFLIDLFQPVSCMGKYFKSYEEVITPESKENYYLLVERIGWNREDVLYVTKNEFEDYLKSAVDLSNHYENYKKTGKSQLTRFDGSKLVLSDEELIEYTRSVILGSKRLSENNLYELYLMINKYDSLKDFWQTYFYDIINFENKEEISYGSYKTK